MHVLVRRKRRKLGREAIIYFTNTCNYRDQMAVSVNRYGAPAGVRECHKTKMVRVDQRTLFSFSMTGMANFLVK